MHRKEIAADQNQKEEAISCPPARPIERGRDSKKSTHIMSDFPDSRRRYDTLSTYAYECGAGKGEETNVLHSERRFAP